MAVIHALLALAGAAVVVLTLRSAVQTLVVPRGTPLILTRWVFLLTRLPYRLRVRSVNSFEKRDAVMASYGPMSLLILALVWLVIVLLGYTAMYRAVEADSWREAVRISGSSLLTLGFDAVKDLPATWLMFTEAALGLGIVALMIAYLPTIYSAFSRRETQVALLESRAGSPPSAVEFLQRASAIGWLDQVAMWQAWEVWFAELEESHTSLASLSFFRSPKPERSWITAAGAVLDAAALLSSTVEGPLRPDAQLCIRAGFVSLRTVAQFFGIPLDPIPPPNDPGSPSRISISRSEYDAAYDRMADAGVPVRPDREQAWLDFAGWRVTYDTPLIALATLVLAPYAPWSSDRSLANWRPSIFPWKRRRGGTPQPFTPTSRVP